MKWSVAAARGSPETDSSHIVTLLCLTVRVLKDAVMAEGSGPAAGFPALCLHYSASEHTFPSNQFIHEFEWTITPSWQKVPQSFLDVT